MRSQSPTPRKSRVAVRTKASIPEQKRVFIIHGRDLEARNSLARLIRAFGVAILDFEEVANHLHHAFVADIVFKGISEADAVVALFTPDEHSALYAPDDPWQALSGPVRDQSRWQARPNVIFEAGVALGARENSTVIVTLGADVELFSDLSGKHILRLDSANGPTHFRDRLSDALGGTLLKPYTKSMAGVFKDVVARRWDYYDEVYLLCTRMRKHYFSTNKKIHLLFVLKQAIRGWDPQKLEYFTPSDLITQIKRLFPKLADEAFWWLLINGVFRFTQDQVFFDNSGDHYTDALLYVEMSERWDPLYHRVLLSDVPR